MKNYPYELSWPSPWSGGRVSTSIMWSSGVVKIAVFGTGWVLMQIDFGITQNWV